MSAIGSGSALPATRIGRFRGVPIYLSASWLAFAAIVIALYARILHQIEGSWPLAILFATGFALLWGISVLLHELGHVVAAQLMNSHVYRVEIGFLGGITTTSTQDERPSEEFWVSIAGPVVSLVLAAPGVIAAFLGSTFAFGLHGTIGVLVGTFTLSNLAVAMFNMLPGLPLDGGRVLVAALWKGKGDQFSATRTAATVGQVLAVAMFAAVVVLVLTGAAGPRRVPLFVGLAIVAVMLWYMANESRRAAIRAERLARKPISTYIEAASAVPAGTTVAEALAMCDTQRIVVTDGATPISIVESGALEAVPVAARRGLLVDDLATVIDPERVLNESASVYDVLMRFTRTGASDFVVTAADGMVIGVVSVDSVTSSR